MKHSFVQIWNSYRHIDDLDPIARSDGDLFYYLKPRLSVLPEKGL
jgi:hypothetical protein